MGGDQTHRIRFAPGLEGLRGLLVLPVLLFHSEFSWAVGGFLALPTFFTLSGYLITSLFLAEWRRSGTIRLAAFWGRRMRRLMPAVLVTLAGMALYGFFLASPDQLSRLRADVFFALFYLANWHFIVTESSYLGLFDAPSPLQHFWSLAVEEQFYVLYPLLAIAVLRKFSGSYRALGVVVGLFAVLSVVRSALMLESGASIDRLYYGSDTRAAEIFVGAFLAVCLYGRELSTAVTQALGALSLMAMVLLWGTVKIEDPWLYCGGFAGYSLLSASVIAAAVQPAGFVRSLLSIPALRWLGRVSYGWYLYHWPIYLWLSGERTGLDPVPLFALRTGVTLAFAEISFRFLETPIRTGRLLPGRRAFVAGSVAVVCVASSVAIATTDRTSSEEADIKRYIEQLRVRQEAGDLRFERPPSASAEVPRVAVFGDSTALTLGLPLFYVYETAGRAVASESVGELGCGLLRAGTFRFEGKDRRTASHCSDRRESWRAAIERGRPDIAVVLVGPWEVLARKLPKDTEWRHIGDPVIDDRVRRLMLEAVDLLAADGTTVFWLTSPPVINRGAVATALEDLLVDGFDPKRMERLNELIAELPSRRPGKVHVVDLAGYMNGLSAGPYDPAYRPDGGHWSILGAQRVARDFLGDEILRIYRAAAAAEADSGVRSR